MQQQIVAAFSPVAVSAVVVAILLAASRLAPFTKPYWTFFPKVVQAGLPSLITGLPLALNVFGAVKTWTDFAQALLVVGAIPLALAAPGMRSPHNDPQPPPPPSPGTQGFERYKPKPPTVPPLLAVGLLLLCSLLPGCGAFTAQEPNFAHAAVYIADAGNAVSAAEALLLRIAFPDVGRFLVSRSSELELNQAALCYAEGLSERPGMTLSGAAPEKTRAALRQMLTGWGHQTAWTEQSAAGALLVVGFSHVCRREYGHGELIGIDGHHRDVGPALPLLESTILEARK